MTSKMPTRGSTKDKLHNLNSLATDIDGKSPPLPPVANDATQAGIDCCTSPSSVPSNAGNPATKSDLLDATSKLESRLYSSLNTNLEKLTDCIQNLTSSLEENTKEVKSILATVNEHTQAISYTDDKVAALEKQNAMKSTQIESLTFRLDKLESERRKYNIIIRGIDEQIYTNPRQAVDTLFTDLGIDIRAADCDTIFRMGTRSLASREQRPIMVKLLKQKDKAKIYRAVKNIPTLPQWKGVSISDDLSPDELNKQRDFRAVVAHAKSLGHNAKLKG